jgi:hypothetical protein
MECVKQTSETFFSSEVNLSPKKMTFYGYPEGVSRVEAYYGTIVVTRQLFQAVS